MTDSTPSPRDRIHHYAEEDDVQPDQQGCFPAAVVCACLLGCALILAYAAACVGGGQ